MALATSAMIVSDKVFAAASKIDDSKHPNSYYHTCKVDGCRHYFEGKTLGLCPMGSWGFVFSNDSSHTNSYKYLSITSYGYDAAKKSYYVKQSINKGGTESIIRVEDAKVDSSICKVVYNGQIYRSSEENSGLLQKYLVGSFRSGCPVK